jgi:hypothetical protein
VLILADFVRRVFGVARIVIDQLEVGVEVIG